MKERPIIMSAPMVRAILAGLKTQTRRVVKPQPTWDGKWFSWSGHAPNSKHGACSGNSLGTAFWMADSCPYGRPGDRLWVREAFIHAPADYCWEASVSIPCRPASTVYRADQDGDTRGAGWSSPIHMPRSLSRITLEITNVRVERLQDISDTDCLSEGIEPVGKPSRLTTGATVQVGKIDGRYSTARALYMQLWESINGPGSWSANPWVWVIEFARVDAQQAAA